MSPVGLLVIVAMVVYAVFRQTQRHEIVGSTRFKLAIIYAVVGVVIGGFNLPSSGVAVTLLVVSVLLSVSVGVIRGRYTRVWQDPNDGRVYGQGTPFTIALFLGLVVTKFALGALAYASGASDDGGVGEIVVMIAIMIAFQAEIVWRRAQPLGARESTRPSHTADTDTNGRASRP